MKLTRSIYLVGGGVWGGMGLSPGPDCNVYLLDGGDALALVDTGSGTPASVDAICAQIEADGFDPARIGTVLLTHMHGDHAGGAARFAELTGAVVRGSALTADVLARGDEEASSVRLAREAGVFPADFELRPLAGIETVAAGDVITVGRLTVEAVDTPGHCDGHVSFVVRSEGRADLLAGDAVRGPAQAEEEADEVRLAGQQVHVSSADRRGMDTHDHLVVGARRHRPRRFRVLQRLGAAIAGLQDRVHGHCGGGASGGRG